MAPLFTRLFAPTVVWGGPPLFKETGHFTVRQSTREHPVLVRMFLFACMYIFICACFFPLIHSATNNCLLRLTLDCRHHILVYWTRIVTHLDIYLYTKYLAAAAAAFIGLSEVSRFRVNRSTALPICLSALGSAPSLGCPRLPGITNDGSVTASADTSTCTTLRSLGHTSMLTFLDLRRSGLKPRRTHSPQRPGS